MYDMKTARELGARYENHIRNTIRSPEFDERDEHTVRGLFVAARRAIVLTQAERLRLIQDQHAIARRGSARVGGWNDRDRAEWNHTHALLDLVNTSLANNGAIVAIIALMLDKVTTPQTRAPLLKLQRPELVPDGATTLQGILCGRAKEVGAWTEYCIYAVAQNRWKGADPLVGALVGIVEQEVYRKLPAHSSIDAAWRAVPVNEFMRLRRDMRKYDATYKSLLVDRKMADRTIRKLEQEKPLSPGSAAKIATARVLSKAYAEQIEVVQCSIDAIADKMVENSRRLDAVLNLEEKCDLLNVNTADRADGKGDPFEDDMSAASIIGGRYKTDSAEFRNARTPFDHPFQTHFMMAVMRRIEQHPGGKEIIQEGLNRFFPGGVIAHMDTKVLSDGSVLVDGENTGVKAVRVEDASEEGQPHKAPSRVLH